MTQKPSGNADTLLQAASRVATLCVLASASLFDSLVFFLCFGVVCTPAMQERVGSCLDLCDCTCTFVFMYVFLYLTVHINVLLFIL